MGEEAMRNCFNEYALQAFDWDFHFPVLSNDMAYEHWLKRSASVKHALAPASFRIYTVVSTTAIMDMKKKDGDGFDYIEAPDVLENGILILYTYILIHVIQVQNVLLI